MARRRSAPAPRRSAPARQPAPVQQNAVQPAAQQPVVLQQKGPGFLSNVASTAAGVTAGHLMLGALTGGNRNEAAPAPQQAAPQQQYAQQPQQNPCSLEMENFLNCTQQQYDLSMCQGLSDALKECRMRYNPSM